MNTIKRTQTFIQWFKDLKDPAGKGAIAARIKKAAFGNFGDHHNVRGPIWELCIDTGPGYRVYYAQEDLTVYLLLVGGSKHSQTKDIDRAEALWNEIKGK